MLQRNINKLDKKLKCEGKEKDKIAKCFPRRQQVETEGLPKI